MKLQITLFLLSVMAKQTTKHERSRKSCKTAGSFTKNEFEERREVFDVRRRQDANIPFKVQGSKTIASIQSCPNNSIVEQYKHFSEVTMRKVECDKELNLSMCIYL